MKTVTEQIPANAIPPTPAQETKPEVKVEEKKIEPASDKFAALAHKDKQLSKKAQDIAQLEAKAKETLAKAEAQMKDFEETRKMALLNPLDAMKKLGLTYEQVTEFILNKEKPSPDAKLEAFRQEFKEWREIQEQKEQKAKEESQNKAKQAETQAVTEFKSSIDEYARANSKDFEFLNSLESKQLINIRELVYSGIQLVYKDTGKIPTIKEALEGTQEYLLGQLDDVISNVAYFKDKYSSKAKEETKTPDGATPTTTLSNSMSVGTSSQMPARTEEERINRAIAAMQAAEKTV